MRVYHKFKSNVVKTFALALILLVSRDSISQEISAKRIDSLININGVLDEEVWESAKFLTDFIQFEPVYGAPSSCETFVKVLYDEKMIYFGFDCKDSETDKITAKITKRDGELENDDGIVIMLDTFNDNNNAYLFTVNPLGTQKDGRIADNGRTVDFKWDESWKSVCNINPDGWSAEIGIPFKILKFNKENTEWGFNAGRRIARNLEKSFSVGNLTAPNRVSQFGTITQLNLGDLFVKRYTIIPYGQAQFQKGEKPEGKAGIDIRYNLSSNLGIESTINPDFATIEGDVEQVNLTMFELRYPEKRPFFLEGAENYSTRIRQFYSRRIGEIPWGVKLTGKINNWKINGLATQSDPSTAGADVQPEENAFYSVFRINRELKRGSNIGVIGANRYYENKNSGSVGFVTTLFFTDVLGMTSQFIKSYGEADMGTWTYFIRPSYDSQFSHFHVRYSHTGEGVMENMNATGFIRDDDRREFDTNISKTFWINKHGIESISPSINYNQYWSQKGILRSWDDSNSLTIKFLKKWKYELEHEEEFKGKYLPKFEKDFRNRLITNELEYDNKKGLSISFEYARGKNYDRDLEKIIGGIDVKIIEGWNVEYQFTKHWFCPVEPDDNSWIHHVRTSYYVNKDLYFKVFYQTKSRIYGCFTDLEFDMLRKTVQVLFVWRFLPPFGSIQLAYQEGTTLHTETSNQGKTLFTKLSWVF
ncbi:MAG: carbohydrate binding family 9 domain-containing protein [Candidatus Marinimicrobia bacterium]|nr:carbohydrate binding family 9 domain-containing protein [Candidatus Neomarinimicrobiota bacterium]